MLELVKTLADASAALIEALGVLIIAGLSLYALGAAGVGLLRRAEGGELFRETRLRLGQGILLGLEFLVAADIIRTVAIEFSWQSVAVLALIVLIRTFLSFTLEVELTGHWPWQSSASGHEEDWRSGFGQGHGGNGRDGKGSAH